jgi:hypothetical protein
VGFIGETCFLERNLCHVIQVYGDGVLRVQHVGICSSEFENYGKYIHDDGGNGQLGMSRTNSAAR